ncbi:nucleoplasmin-2 [Dromiciops gliroides]|uniref:nucleoplasmin-2 n=1 Tax=Dromiciops gliroides TaxID=33562 RepID=UPI001CC451A3|nr:nucleoplasmin-2 [Dromiciops gliroides]
MPLTSVSSKAEKSSALFWGCELNWDNRSYTFDPLEDEKCRHKLVLHLMCLGEKINDDVNIVEVVPPPNEHGEEKSGFPIATLKPSVLPMANISGMELSPPITFHLRCGTGPVYISGSDLTVTLEPSSKEVEGKEEGTEEEEEEEEDDDDDDDDNDSDDDEDDDEDDSHDTSTEISPPKPAKRLASCSQAGVAKKKKLEEEQRVPSPRSPEMKQAKSKMARMAFGKSR